MLHPKKYESHVLEDLRSFYEGSIGYPEISLKLAGEEGWLRDVNPKLGLAVHKIIKTLHKYLDHTPYEYNREIPRYIIYHIFSDIAPEINELMNALGKDNFFSKFLVVETNTSPLPLRMQNELY